MERGSRDMKISACYIVKNEAKTLARSIRSLTGQADELIVVDTGSTDGTRGVAEEHGARVISAPWQDDFSAPRNLALEQAAGDWIVFLDGDEFFTEDTGGHLRRVIEGQQGKGVQGILMRRLDIDEDKGNELQADTFVLRIFRRDPKLRYRGRIHEELREAGQPIQGLYFAKETELLLLHTGYSTTRSREKAERNLRILREELEQGENAERLYGYLADAYWGLDDRENAEHYARLDIAQGRRAVTYASRSYRILLELLAGDGARAADRLQAAQDAVRDFPEIPEFHGDYAESLALQGRYQDALREMRRALEVYHGPRGAEPVLFTSEMERIALGRIALWEKKSEESRQQSSGSVAADWQKYRKLFLAELYRMEAEQGREPWMAGILPAALERLLRAYGASAALPETEAGIFQAALPWVLAKATEEMALRYAGLAVGFSADTLCCIADAYMEAWNWQGAFLLYRQVPADSSAVDGAFWKQVGICLFHLGEKAAAAECMERAEAAGLSDGETAAYLAWCREESGQ